MGDDHPDLRNRHETRDGGKGGGVIELRLLPAALLPALLLAGVLGAGIVAGPASSSVDDGPAVQMTVTPTR